MTTFLDEIGRAVRQTACAVIATNDAVNGFMEGVGVPGAEAYANRTRALRRQLCDNNDDSVPTPTPPFTGGQCSGVEYEVQVLRNGYTRIECDDGSTSQRTGPGNLTVTVYGPISGLRRVDIDQGDCGPRASRILLDAFDSNGDPISPTIYPVSVNGAFFSIGDFDVSITSITRVDGQPDNCGDIPTPIPPYAPTPTNVTINYENNQEITVNEDVDITIFAPQVNLIGGIFAPITIAGNTFSLVGTVELTPEFKLNLSPEITVNLGGGNTDSPTPNPDRPIPEPTPDPNERRVIVGAIATATSVGGRQDFLPQDANPDIAIPNLGYVAFYINTPNGTAWTEDIPIKNVRSYIPCPNPAGAIDTAGTGRPGIAIQVQPVWGYPGQQL